MKKWRIEIKRTDSNHNCPYLKENRCTVGDGLFKLKICEHKTCPIKSKVELEAELQRYKDYVADCDVLDDYDVEPDSKREEEQG